MFPITLPNLLIIAVVAGIGGVFLLWLVADMARRRREGRATKDLCLCRLCGAKFYHPRKGEVFDCPHCHAANEHDRFREI